MSENEQSASDCPIIGFGLLLLRIGTMIAEAKAEG
jgi:hypothetical protein